jgi:hypothetical protein
VCPVMVAGDQPDHGRLMASWTIFASLTAAKRVAASDRDLRAPRRGGRGWTADDHDRGGLRACGAYNSPRSWSAKSARPGCARSEGRIRDRRPPRSGSRERTPATRSCPHPTWRSGPGPPAV